MAAAAAIFNQHSAVAQALTAAPAASTGSSGSSSTSDSGDSATISANDFLTLLVTEMQNQDPTADTDPNEYINQLVSVNSLEQLIDINQTLTTSLAPSSTTASSGSASPQAMGASPAVAATPAASAASVHSPAAASKIGAITQALTGSASGTSGQALQAPGNLSVPSANASARQVAHALDGRHKTSAVGGTR